MTTRMLSLVGILTIVCFCSISFSRCTKSKPVVTDSVTVDVDTNVNLAKGLVVYYAFNNSLADSSGGHHNGTGFGNIKFAADKAGNPNGAVVFDGKSYIMLRDSGALSSPSLTIDAQFYTDTALWENVFSKINFSNSNSIVWALTLFGSTGTYPKSAAFGIRGPDVECGQFDPMSNFDLVYATVDIQPKKWYHVTCVMDNGVEKIYLNGVLRNAVTRPFNSAKQCVDASMVLGAWWQNIPLNFYGKMDEFRFYNRALNDQEIARLDQGL